MHHFKREDVQTIIDMMERIRSEPHIEIEARLGRIHSFEPARESNHDKRPVFEPNLGEHAFEKIIQKLKTNPHWTKTTQTRMVDTFYPRDIRKSTFADGSVKVLTKKKLDILDIPLDNQPFDVRICVSKEVPYDRPLDHIPPVFQREKFRTSFQHKRTFCYDGTQVTDDIGKVSYEFEIELVSPQEFINTRGTRHVVDSFLCKIEDVLRLF